MDWRESELPLHQPIPEPSSEPQTVTNVTVTYTAPPVFKAFSMVQGSWEACDPYGHLGSLCPFWRDKRDRIYWLDWGSGSWLPCS